ncbi:MAG: translation initiation factor IF-2 [Parachlamydiaceae bacterium]|nr:translation initiation factor IF-2 [Parachlamydiaceae bacterium]
MAKNLKLNIKNTQIAQAIDLGGLKSKLAKTKAAANPLPQETSPPVEEVSLGTSAPPAPEEGAAIEAPRIRARSKSAFAEPQATETKIKKTHPPEDTPEVSQLPEAETSPKRGTKAKAQNEEPLEPRQKTSEELRKEIFAEELKESATAPAPARFEAPKAEAPSPAAKERVFQSKPEKEVITRHVEPLPTPMQSVEAPMPPLPTQSQEPASRTPVKNEPASETKRTEHSGQRPVLWNRPEQRKAAMADMQTPPPRVPMEKLGPTGRHVSDLLPKRPPPRPVEEPRARQGERPDDRRPAPPREGERDSSRPKPAETSAKPKESTGADALRKDLKPGGKTKEFRDVRPTTRKVEVQRTFDARDRQGLRSGDDDRKGWRKKRLKPQHLHHEELTVRPTTLSIRLPIAIKDLASEMKLKASQLISKLFMQGVAATLNDFLDDEITIQLLGHEFGCEITIDTAEEERLRITAKTIKEEIGETEPSLHTLRPPVVAFMGHVDHGKTSLIDFIRKSNRASGEAGAITQHIGAFRCHTAVGDIAILDTPGHEAFSSMRARGADVTDIVVLVVAGDEGIQTQTIEAIHHAKSAKVSIVVAINKCDKPNFNAETIYRQLAEQDLLPESWGGQTITVNCSAISGEGIPTLLEMLALQAEVLELKANPTARARGSVLESEMHKGMGPVATVLVQNGTLRLGDALVFGQMWGRVKTMQNEFGKDLKEAGPSTPVEITGLSGLPDAGEEFISVKNEREAREIAEGRLQGFRQNNLLLKKKLSLENIFQNTSGAITKKVLNIVLRADVQGSLEALKVALLKITSTKAELNIIFAGVGEISESDVQLAAASKAVIVGFHTQVESHADSIVKELGIQVRLHDIIYHAIDDVKVLLAGLLDKIAIETEKGKAFVKATFKSSQYGIIAGCQVSEGTIHRNHQIRLLRGKEVIWKGTLSSLKRGKEDVREVTKGLECGIVLNGFSAYLEADIIESYEITYIIQEL